MKNLVGIIGCMTFLLTACENVQSTDSIVSSNDGDFITDLPESLLAIVGPNQNLNTVMLDPTDGCYVYQYVGPVETTFVPLRSVRGRVICIQKPVVATPT